MPYLSSIWVAANKIGHKESADYGLFKYTNGTEETKVATGTSPWGVLVCRDRRTQYVVNQDDNTVSQVRDGSVVAEIATNGSSPYGICEGSIADKHGDYPVFVTNYASNTVTKIVNGKVNEVFGVGQGPRGICCDTDGNIWVANYLDNTLSVIWKGMTLYEGVVNVANGPDGICCDSRGNIYVACAISGVVTKVSHQVKMADINVGDEPRAIAVDLSDNIWVGNFSSGTVTRINGADLETSEFICGRGPISIGVTKDVSNDYQIVVANYTDKNIAILDPTSGARVEKIETAFNPVAFGDFTGFQSYLMGKKYDSQNPDGTDRVTWDDLAPELQEMIKGMVGLPQVVKAPDVILLNHRKYPTVQVALDHLLYEPITLKGFGITKPANGIAEIGSTISEVEFGWNLQNSDNVASQYVNCTANPNASVGFVAAGINTAKKTDVNITANTTWELVVRDQNNMESKAQASIKFLPKIYYGVSDRAVVKSDDILKLGHSEFIEIEDGRVKKEMHFDATGGGYMVFAIPSAYRLNAGGDITIGGLINSDWNVKQNFRVTNESGYTNNYDVYTSGNLQTDENIPVLINYQTTNSDSTDLPNSAGNHRLPDQPSTDGTGTTPKPGASVTTLHISSEDDTVTRTETPLVDGYKGNEE